LVSTVKENDHTTGGLDPSSCFHSGNIRAGAWLCPCFRSQYFRIHHFPSVNRVHGSARITERPRGIDAGATWRSTRHFQHTLHTSEPIRGLLRGPRYCWNSEGSSSEVGDLGSRSRLRFMARLFRAHRFQFQPLEQACDGPYDGCLFWGNQIIMPESSRDKLTPEEWAPLIASELVYQRKLLEKRRLGLLIRILPLTAVYIIIPAVLWQLGILNLQGMTTVRGAPTPVSVAFFELYSGTALIFTMILYDVLGFRFNRQMRLKADAIAASMMSKAVFLSALEKIGRAFPSILT